MGLLATSELVVLVPVLRRPHRVRPTISGFGATVPGCRIVFISDPDDLPERQAIESYGGEQLAVSGNYARKIRAGVEATEEPLIFTGADDLLPHKGWFGKAKAHMKNGVQVVGVNDFIMRRREHATHFLMTREYAERSTIDGGSGPFHDGYSHWYCDDELIATAAKRGVYSYAKDAITEHFHPDFGKAPDDDTYRKGRANRHSDRRLFRRRSALWT